MVTVAKSAEADDAEADLLALHVAQRLVHGQAGERGVALRLRPVGDGDAREEEHAIAREERPALPRVPHHPPVGVGQGRGDGEDEQHLEEVGERRRVLERVGGVGVEEAAAVGAELLDRLLRGDRAHGRASASRPRAWSRSRYGARFWMHALRDEHQREDDARAAAARRRCRGSRSTQKLPSVFGPPARPAREAAGERQRDADARRRRDEVVPGQARHLGEVAHRRLAGVRLPVGVGGEAGGGVEGELRLDRRRGPAG